MPKPQIIVLRRSLIEEGKYTRWASELDEGELFTLLWMVGEFGYRSSPDDPDRIAGSPARKEVARQIIVDFTQYKPIDFSEGRRRIVEASLEELNL